MRTDPFCLVEPFFDRARSNNPSARSARPSAPARRSFEWRASVELYAFWPLLAEFAFADSDAAEICRKRDVRSSTSRLSNLPRAASQKQGALQARTFVRDL